MLIAQELDISTENQINMPISRVFYTLEFPIKSSPQILFEYLYTPSGLQEWFADKVDRKDQTFKFTWNGNTDIAYLESTVENESVKFRWEYYDEGEYFEFSIYQSDVTNETILKVSDFADNIDIESQKQLWAEQIKNLKKRIGG